MTERRAAAIACAVRTLLTQMPSREATRQYAQRFDWQSTSTGQFSLFHKISRPSA